MLTIVYTQATVLFTLSVNCIANHLFTTVYLVSKLLLLYFPLLSLSKPNQAFFILLLIENQPETIFLFHVLDTQQAMGWVNHFVISTDICD